MVFFSKAKFIHFDADEASKRGGVLWFAANVAGFMLALNTLNAVRSARRLSISCDMA
jgi:hypothetical protein